jgi:nucleotide-binding universal stress UspA family protein
VSRAGPVLIAFDGTPAAEHAIREGGPLLAGRNAVVLVVWKQGLAFDLVALPASAIGLPPAQIDVAAVLEGEREIYRAAESQAQRGAALAREAGLEAEPHVVADDPETPIHETILRVARERDAAAILVGSHGHGPIGAMLLGGITRGVLRQAEVPVVVVRHATSDRD